MTQLGAGFPERTRTADLVDRMHQEIEAAVMTRVDDALRALKLPAPVVNVAAPNVSVQAPPIIVNVPEDGDDGSGDMAIVDCLNAVCARLQTLDQHLVALTEMLGRPVTRTVSRGAGQLIETVTERRG